MKPVLLLSCYYYIVDMFFLAYDNVKRKSQITQQRMTKKHNLEAITKKE